jgi:hypothetical protein
MVDGSGCHRDPVDARDGFDRCRNAEVGDFSRFGNPRQLMAYLGLVPSGIGVAAQRAGMG